MSDQKLVVISFDAMVREDITNTLKDFPHFKWMLENGAQVNTLRSVYPTITYPVHASILTGVPVIELKGQSEAVILRHRGIVAFQNDAVRIASSVGVLVVFGSDLTIFRMNRERIILHGRISRVEIGAQPC